MFAARRERQRKAQELADQLAASGLKICAVLLDIYAAPMRDRDKRIAMLIVLRRLVC